MTHDGRSLRFVELPKAAMTALLNKDLEEASSAAGIALTGYFISESAIWLWRYRLNQLSQDPTSAAWIVRAVAVAPEGPVVGHGGFHRPPDAVGMVEVGYAVDPACRRRGIRQGNPPRADTPGGR